MSKGVAYFLGILTGVVLTIAAAFVISSSTNGGSAFSGLTMFEERGEMMPESSFKIFQALDENHALATGISNEEYEWYMGITVMIVGDEGSHFYDDQILKTKSGKRFYQVGTYKYQTKNEDWKTVPVVALLDRK